MKKISLVTIDIVELGNIKQENRKLQAENAALKKRVAELEIVLNEVGLFVVDKGEGDAK